MVTTVPPELPPGSDVANLGLLGYNASENYTGRAPIEAAGGGIPMGPDDVAYRCNLVTVRNGRMHDYSAGHISTEEGHELVGALDQKLGRDGLRFHGGVQYRHLLIWKNGPVKIKTQPPHDIAGKPVADNLPSGERSNEVRALMESSKPIFAEHPVNLNRSVRNLEPATQAWLWGQGRSMKLESFAKKYGLRGGVISAVDLVRGIGVLAGLEAPRVPGATGFLDTNYPGKVSTALKILSTSDFIYIHIEAPDECGHLGDWQKKRQAIEDFDRHVVGPVWRALENKKEPYRLLVAMDHRTPVSIRGHSREPVPLAVLNGPVGPVSKDAAFDESINGGRAQANSWEWVSELLRGAGKK
jgi:2,3-bisphosphoglycerate-independent phosphoglycerate mutase